VWVPIVKVMASTGRSRLVSAASKVTVTEPVTGSVGGTAPEKAEKSMAEKSYVRVIGAAPTGGTNIRATPSPTPNVITASNRLFIAALLVRDA
jgi:hypothetical protein